RDRSRIHSPPRRSRSARSASRRCGCSSSSRRRSSSRLRGWDPRDPPRHSHARHVSGSRHGRADGCADRPDPHDHVRVRVRAGGGRGSAARPRLPRLPLDGRPRFAEGVLRRHSRRPRQPRRSDPRRPAAGRRRRAGRGLRLVGLSRRGGLRRHHSRADVPARRTLRARGTHRLIARAAVALGAGAALTAPWWVANPYHLHVLIMAAIFTILALSLNLLLGYTGQLSLGHAAFFGIGAYTSALLSLPPLEWSFWIALPAAAAASGLAGWGIGRLALKLRGAYFVLVTISFAGVISLISINWMALTNGPLGLPGVPAPTLGSWPLRTKTAYWY